MYTEATKYIYGTFKQDENSEGYSLYIDERAQVGMHVVVMACHLHHSSSGKSLGSEFHNRRGMKYHLEKNDYESKRYFQNS